MELQLADSSFGQRVNYNKMFYGFSVRLNTDTMWFKYDIFCVNV